MKGNLFVVEGCDGTGKSTLCEGLVASLRLLGHNVSSVSFPGRKPNSLGGLVYKLHHSPGELGLSSVEPTSLQCLHVAAHFETISTVILPALDDGVTVILDRYWWSTFVYGAVAGIDKKVLTALIRAEKQVWAGVRPAIVFLLDRESPLREEPLDTWASCKVEYLSCAELEKCKYPVEIVKDSPNSQSTLALVQNMIVNRITKVKKKPQAQLELSISQLCSRKASSDSVANAWAPLCPTEILDVYWTFATRRQDVFFQRLEGRKPPWTNDNIIQNHKFTNAYRASDRVSQFLIKNVIYSGEQNFNEVFFRTLLFKFFNKIETWQLLESALGVLSWRDFSFERYDKVLEGALSKGQRIYSAAYIMPTGGPGTSFPRKHQMHLRLLQRMMGECLPQSWKVQVWRRGFIHYAPIHQLGIFWHINT
ncbi:nucleotide kinase domain-containing protein [Verrucomicrobium sp. BvORR034]|uniref:nucleotide kinase domain-containing protein n=1 Tax=Verrucomicrobium sp. BvORR034 TaxID=1396418 RepID=UPI000B1E6DCC